MNDRLAPKAIVALCNSPSALLRSLGVEEIIYRFRPQALWHKTGDITLGTLDCDIASNGRAYPLRIERVDDTVERLRLLCLRDNQHNLYKIVTLRFDYLTGEHLFEICFNKYRDLEVFTVSQLGTAGYQLLPLCQSPIIYP
ncbi:MAG: hypothetical protein Q8O53_00020 [Candidatus Moranbacteria bacterium]|nr:hypothetical protein [Candidatus Moranbacteria bacterium]